MINIDVLTIGNELKDADGVVYKVTSNFSEKGKMFVELTKVANEPLQELLKE